MNGSWTFILSLVAAALMIWMLIRFIRGNPQAFSKENMSKSIFTMGILALLLMGVIFFLRFVITQ